MQVNSVSLNSTKASNSFGRRDLEREIIESFANADDKALRQIALKDASHSVNDKKHNRITNAIFYTIPFAAGLAAVVRNPATAIGKLPKVRGTNLANFVGTSLSWLGTFAVIDTVFGASKLLDKKSETVRKFNDKHPMLSTVATFGAAIGSLFLAKAGLSKLVAKGAAKPLNIAEKKLLVKVNQSLNNSKVLNKASDLLKKVPSSIKSIAKTAIDWAPMTLVFTSIAHSMNHSKAKSIATANNYAQLKEAQMQAREVLAAEDTMNYEEVNF